MPFACQVIETYVIAQASAAATKDERKVTHDLKSSSRYEKYISLFQYHSQRHTIYNNILQTNGR